MNKIFNKQTILIGFIMAIVNFTSIAVVTQVIGLNVPVAFFISGVITLIMHSITKHTIPNMVGISGLFIGGFLSIASKQGTSYALGGVVMAGMIYITLGIIFYYNRDLLRKYVPQYIIGASLMLIGLSLLPISKNLVEGSLVTGLIAIATMLLIEIKYKGIVKLLSMPIALSVSTLYHYLAIGLEPSITTGLDLSIQSVKFSLPAFTTISIIALVTMFEVLSDTAYSAEIANKDLYDDVGIHKVFIVLGLGSVLAGFTGVSVPTTYSECNSANKILGNKDAYALDITAVIFIVLGFLATPLQFISYIPLSAFGGILTVLFATISISGIKQIFNSDLDLNNHHSRFLVLATMLGLSFISFVFYGVQVSSVSIAIIFGILLNSILSTDINDEVYIGEE